MSEQTTILQDQLNKLWTTTDLCRRFKKEPMTIYLWRRDRKLPAIIIPGSSRPTVRFVPDDVRKWAANNNIRVYPV